MNPFRSRAVARRCQQVTSSTLLLVLAASVAVAVAPARARGQLAGVRDAVSVGAQVIGVITRASPAIRGEDLTESYLTQPAIMITVAPWREALTLRTTINFEGSTIEDGELNAGIFGEGFIDRRHPHTYLHELVASSARRFGSGPNGVSVTLGKGFAPFGTDDPMARPFEKYPINHHLAQILERAVAIAALRANGFIIEAGSFNGDEPTSPGDVPDRKRYWDSWSGRVTYVPWPQGEFQVSYARVKSPENPTGQGADQRKQSASVRLEDAQHSGYALVEFARTRDYAGSTPSFSYNSLLAETWARFDLLSGALRFERTERPEEPRLVNEFRTAVPASDLSIAGVSRWTIITARLAAALPATRWLTIEPFTEVARARVAPTSTPAGFDPRQFYGSDRLWSVSVGAKVSFGMSHMRMGRYGVAVAEQSGTKMAGMNMHHM